MPAAALPQPVTPQTPQPATVTWGPVAASGLVVSRPDTSAVTVGGAR